MTDVIGVIGARLNSSRLPAKHLLDLAGQPMIARIVQRLERIPELDQIVLATTADEYNRPLVDWAQQSGCPVFAHEGDVDDLVGRIDAVVAEARPHIVVYFCGDSPLIDPGTVSRMIRALQQSPAADHVRLLPAPGYPAFIHEGFSPYRYRTWRHLVDEARTRREREHVGLSLQRFSDSLDTVSVMDEPVFSRLQHRISVDTPSDYRFMSEVYRRWYDGHDTDSIVSLPWVMEQLEKDPALRGINAHVRQKAVSDRSIPVFLVTQCGPEIGLGHLMRMRILAHALQDGISAGVRLLIQGDVVEHPQLALLPHRFVSREVSLDTAIREEMEERPAAALIFDLAPAWVPAGLGALLDEQRRAGRLLIGIDGLFDFASQLDRIHVPSFYLAPRLDALVQAGKVSYGWQNYFLPPVSGNILHQHDSKVLVLTGGSDASGLGRVWPALLDAQLPAETEIHWVQGPFAEAPDLPPRPRLRWECHTAPEDLPSMMSDYSHALVLYGVSLFELLQRGIPSVVLSPGAGRAAEMQSLAHEEVAVIADSPNEAVLHLSELIRNPFRARKMSAKARARLGQAEGGAVLAAWIAACLESGQT